MWIKHNKTLYNSVDITKIEAVCTKLIATFRDGEKVTIGEFRAAKEAEDILRSVSQALLFEDSEHPGIIIRDTKGKKDGD
jgi:hypothetical protein